MLLTLFGDSSTTLLSDSELSEQQTLNPRLTILLLCLASISGSRSGSSMLSSISSLSEKYQVCDSFTSKNHKLFDGCTLGKLEFASCASGSFVVICVRRSFMLSSVPAKRDKWQLCLITRVGGEL